MNELKEILSGLLVLSEQLGTRAPAVPGWLTGCAALALVIAFYGWLARQLMTKEVFDFTRGLLRCGAAFLTWLSAQPEQMFAGPERSLLRRPMAVSAIALGGSLGLGLIPALWTLSQVLTQPNHPRFFWAGPAYVAECFLLFLCKQLVHAGWKHAR